ncbi:Tetratricopeptide repeat-containing protein [Parafrankia irregularis]|uniref:Tetratricopeptide repeat-containing protein n=1 Tax=Parafrankia irregularis TaxID=795642 RepID=A0A0S4QMB0_9ACTN|nr:tetratricopeptide repeat protein [Parafrankia sp. CH37]CUU56621.1 Tetratricopeptide repeat-containing protein [Parafrankia irregularis]
MDGVVGALGPRGQIDFFVSHAGQDAPWAEWIGETLERAGYSVELDVWDWTAGTHLVAALERALERAHRMIAVISPMYLERSWTSAQRYAAFAVHAEESEGFLVPVVVSPCAAVPRLLRPLSNIDLVGQDEPEARRRLLRALAPAASPDIRADRRPGHPPATLTGRTMLASPPDHGPDGAAGARGVAFPGGVSAVHNLPARDHFFTGRGDELQVMSDLLHGDAGPGLTAICALHGEPGMGKSQLALEYGWRNVTSYRTALWWINAEESTGAATGMAGLAEALGLAVSGGPSDLRRRVFQELSRSGDFLLIYDNVVDKAILDELPSGGHVIVTSRDPALSDRFPTVPVGTLPRAQTVLLLRRRAGRITEVEADRLATAVADLPSAAAQAGAFLAGSRTDPGTYCETLANAPDGLSLTTVASLEELARRDPAALDLLRRLAYLAPEPIPLAAHRTSGPDEGKAVLGRPGSLLVGDAATTGELVDVIIGLGLATVSDVRMTVQRPVRALVRASIPADSRRTVLVRAMRLLATADPGEPRTPAHWLAYAELTPHVVAIIHALDDQPCPEPARFRGLLLATCHYLQACGQFRLGLRLATRTHQRWTAVLGADHPDTLAAAARRAVAVYRNGQVEAARTLDVETLQRRRRVLGVDHPDTLTSASNLAVWLFTLGEWMKARGMDENTLARRREVLGSDHPDTLTSAANLAVRLAALGEHEAARVLDEDTFTRRRHLLGEDHPDTLTSAANLANRLAALGEHEAARALDENTLARRREVLGSDHPDTLTSAANLAHRLLALDERAAARALAEDTVARRRRLVDEEFTDPSESGRQT